MSEDGKDPAHEAVDGKDAARQAVGAAHRKLETAEDDVAQSVVDARHAKVTWRQIAVELGVAQPNASRKYKPFVDSRTARNVWAGELDPELLALAAVRKALQAFRDAEAAEVQAVADARNARVTWEDIAAELGVAQPNAVVKFRPLLVETVEVTVRESITKR